MKEQKQAHVPFSTGKILLLFCLHLYYSIQLNVLLQTQTSLSISQWAQWVPILWLFPQFLNAYVEQAYSAMGRVPLSDWVSAPQCRQGYVWLLTGPYTGQSAVTYFRFPNLWLWTFEVGTGFSAAPPFPLGSALGGSGEGSTPTVGMGFSRFSWFVLSPTL